MCDTNALVTSITIFHSITFNISDLFLYYSFHEKKKSIKM